MRPVLVDGRLCKRLVVLQHEWQLQYAQVLSHSISIEFGLVTCLGHAHLHRLGHKLTGQVRATPTPAGQRGV